MVLNILEHVTRDVWTQWTQWTQAVQSAAGDVCHGGHWANEIICLTETKTVKSTPGGIAPPGVPRARLPGYPSVAQVKSPHEPR